MGFTIIFFIAFVALWIWWEKTHYNDSPGVKNRIKGRDDEQKAAIRYFCNKPNFLSKKPISDEEYEDIIRNFLKSHDFKKKAINKLGLDEDQVKEIEPVHFEGYVYNDEKALAKVGKDGLWRSSKYQITWLFFSDTEVYIYQYSFFLDQDGRSERTEDYFYKDITSFTTISDTEETPQYDEKMGKTFLVNVDSNRFAITVPGDRFYCSIEQNDYTERSIQGMKAKLREKKS
ncbi:MAG: hypothetical protein J6Y97_07925 [Prevotella sp.]|nr:hypothetical protein [Prevotella sp.]